MIEIIVNGQLAEIEDIFECRDGDTGRPEYHIVPVKGDTVFSQAVSKGYIRETDMCPFWE